MNTKKQDLTQVLENESSTKEPIKEISERGKTSNNFGLKGHFSPAVRFQGSPAVLNEQLKHLQRHQINMQHRQQPFFRVMMPRVLHLLFSTLGFASAILVIHLAYLNLGVLPALAAMILLFKSGVRFMDDVLRIIVDVTISSQRRFDLALQRADTMLQPITSKQGEYGSSGDIHYALSCMQGWRRTMEDDHSIVIEPEGNHLFFGIYDGHCGNQIAKLCGSNLHQYITQTKNYRYKNYEKALQEGFVTFDKDLYSKYPDERSGCAALTLLIVRNSKRMYCANAGDSRCVLCCNGKPLPLSEDHKPNNVLEEMRIKRAGSYVANRRVNSVLALSRSIGDFSFKKANSVSWENQAVTSNPDVQSVTINPENDQFVVLACDGVWDVMSNEQVINFIRLRITLRVPLQRICEELMDSCLSVHPFGLGCDNMSVIILVFGENPSIADYLRVIETKQKEENFTPSDVQATLTESNGDQRTDSLEGELTLDNADSKPKKSSFEFITEETRIEQEDILQNGSLK